MLHSFRYLGLALGSVVAATIATTSVSLGDVKKTPTKFVNRLPVKVIVTFEGTGVPTGPWYAERNETKAFLLLPETTNVRWKAIPAVVAGSTFDTCTGSQTIGSGNSSDTIVLNGDHCAGSGHPAAGSGSANAAAKPGSALASGSGSGSGTTASNKQTFRVTVKNIGDVPVKVTVTFVSTKIGDTNPFYPERSSGLIAPKGQDTVVYEWPPGAILSPSIAGWKAYREGESNDCNGANYPGNGSLSVSCGPKPK